MNEKMQRMYIPLAFQLESEAGIFLLRRRFAGVFYNATAAKCGRQYYSIDGFGIKLPNPFNKESKEVKL